MLVGRNKEAGGSTSGVENALVFIRIHNLDNKIDNMARGTELTSIALATKNRKQILVGIAQIFAVVVGKFIYYF